MRWLVCLAVCCGGCGSSLQYQGWTPSFRYMRDEPGFNEVYFGADANFVIEDRSATRQPLVASSRPLDAWNTPVAWQPLTTPVVNAVQEAAVSPEPAILDDNK
jgi:hypothetical protein